MLDIKLRQIIFYFCMLWLSFPIIILFGLGMFTHTITEFCEWCAEKIEDFYIWSKE